jgi:hypothetical protein
VSRQALSAYLYRLGGSVEGEHPSCSEAPFTDVSTSHPFCGEIAWMTATHPPCLSPSPARGTRCEDEVPHYDPIATGYADGSFHPGDPVSRQAMAAFLFRFDRLP